MAMRMLLPSEYDESYFEGKQGDYRHNAGYSNYKDVGFESLADKIVTKYPNIVGKRVVDVGCAYGYLVKYLRDRGVDCLGRDISNFAISQAEPSISPFLQVKDVLDNYPNNIDGIISVRFLVCFDEPTVDLIIAHFNTSVNFQLHIIDQDVNEKYYLEQPLSWWAEKPWNPGTILIKRENTDFDLIKT